MWKVELIARYYNEIDEFLLSRVESLQVKTTNLRDEKF